MPDLDQIKQEEQGPRDRRGRFLRGHSGNPAGRPKGCRDRANRAGSTLLAEAGEALARKAVALALAGDPAAIRLCLERLAGPCRERAVEFLMPAIDNAGDVAPATAKMLAAGLGRSGSGADALQAALALIGPLRRDIPACPAAFGDGQCAWDRAG
jgi:Family of unknown function (DUF5681)